MISDLPRFKDDILLRKYLLCEEDYRNNLEKLYGVIDEAGQEATLLLTGLSSFLKLADYTVIDEYPKKSNILPAKYFPVFKIKKEGSVIAELSYSEMIKLGNKVYNLIEVYLRDYFDI